MKVVEFSVDQVTPVDHLHFDGTFAKLQFLGEKTNAVSCAYFWGKQSILEGRSDLEDEGMEFESCRVKDSAVQLAVVQMNPNQGFDKVAVSNDSNCCNWQNTHGSEANFELEPKHGFTHSILFSKRAIASKYRLDVHKDPSVQRKGIF